MRVSAVFTVTQYRRLKMALSGIKISGALTVVNAVLQGRPVVPLLLAFQRHTIDSALPLQSRTDLACAVDTTFQFSSEDNIAPLVTL